jgi:acyl-CoA synthetase (AMP-forming)/AMP-acid ligase II
LIERKSWWDRMLHAARLMTVPLARVSSPIEACPPHETLVAAFEAAARAHAPFVTIHGGKEPVSRTSEAALEAAHRWAKLLASRGVKKGDRVLVLLPTGHAFVEALLGSMLLGAVPVPLATPMTFGSVDRYLVNLAAIANDCRATATVTYGRIRDALAKEPSLAAPLGEVVSEGDLDGVASVDVKLPSLGGNDTAFLQYTSGTTGTPKGAIISHRAIVSNAFSIAAGLQLTDSDVGVSWLPLFHDMGLIGVLLTSICHPYAVHVMSPESFVMNPRRWLSLIAQVGGTISAAPNFAYDMTVARSGDVEGLRLDTWRCALNGAEPVQTTSVSRFLARFAAQGFRADAPMPVYGMAEATLAVTFPSLATKMETLEVDRDALEARKIAQPAVGGHTAVSVGRPVAGMRIEVVGEDGRVLLERTIGDIRVAGPSLMDGYFGKDEASADAIAGGWLRTGDLGFVDGGRLFVTGREKELIIKGGRNVYPYDVERVAGDVEGVRQGGVAAFGRTNTDTGTEDLVVIAETSHRDREQREVIAKAMRGELLAVLGIKADEIRFCGVGKVPRTTSGKIRRRECARMFGEGTLG